MPHYLSSEPPEAILRSLGDAMDLVNVGVLLLDRELRARFINRRYGEIWNIEPAILATSPTYRQLLGHAVARGCFSGTETDLATYLDEREAAVRAGSFPPTVLDLMNHRQVLLHCSACTDGGRILTYADISDELRREALDVMGRMSAEVRFNCDMLESQGEHLARLAEAAEESSQRAEAARLLLESEIVERRQLETMLRQMATTDGLTGALNRGELLASAQHMMTAGHRLVVLMLDVDHFKSVNDRYGHAGGDQALQHLVTTLRTGIRQIDLLGRLGGEEFAIVLPDAALTVAQPVAERLRAEVAGTPVTSGDRQISITVSIGLATQLETERSVEQIMARADAALYQAKGGGRNRVVIAA
jgi:diguanylate cyclase (GGDEF)-like protein